MREFIILFEHIIALSQSFTSQTMKIGFSFLIQIYFAFHFTRSVSSLLTHDGVSLPQA